MTLTGTLKIWLVGKLVERTEPVRADVGDEDTAGLAALAAGDVDIAIARKSDAGCGVDGRPAPPSESTTAMN